MKKANVPLTSLDKTFDKKVQATPSGMAFWAMTGPENTFCKTCKSFEKSDRKEGVGNCATYTEMTGMDGKSFDALTPSCKYYASSQRRT